MITQRCSGPCNEVKNIDEFYVRSDNGKPNGQCKVCIKQYQKKYNGEHKEEKKEYNVQYRTENIEEIREYDRARGQTSDRKLKVVEYQNDNREFIRQSNQNYYKNNKESVLKQHNKRHKERIKEDPIYALRKNASRTISCGLKDNGGSKQGQSILKYLGAYYFIVLKIHIEALFSAPENLTPDGKVWMTWKNRGVYDPETWDEKDPSTWTWQLDHIRPHSLFKYATMDCQEFRDCWAISNLRPLNAKINNHDGATKIRHK